MRMALLSLLLSAPLVSCTHSNSKQCGPVTCPANAHCGPNNECVPPECGNGVIDPLEMCDGAMDLECSDFGYSNGPALTCNAVCQVDTSACFDACGNHLVEFAELCDGIPPAGFGCADFGYDIGPLACSPACSPTFLLCDSIGWQVAPGGGTNELRAITATSTKAGFAVGLGGTILRANDGVWSQMVSNTSEHLYGVAGTMNGVIAVGAAGTIVRFDGTSWTPMTSGTPEDLFAIAATGPQTAIAVGGHGLILRFDGTAWSTMVDANVSKPTLRAVWAGPTNAFAVGDAGTVMRSDNGVWAPQSVTGITSANNLTTVFAVGGIVFIGGEDRLLVKTDGATAQTIAIPNSLALPTSDVLSMWASSPSDLFIGMDAGALFHYDGTKLTRFKPPSNRSSVGLVGFGPTEVLGVTRGGFVVQYNGSDRRRDTIAVNALHAVSRVGSTLYAAGVSSTVVRTDATSDTWTPMDTSAIPSVKLDAVWSDGTDVWAASDIASPSPDIFRSQAGGPFAALSAPAGAYAMWGSASPLHIIAVGATVLESTNGSTFVESTPNLKNGLPVTLRGVFMTPDGVWFAVGNGGFTMRRTGTSGTWTLMLDTGTNEDLYAVWGTSTNDVFAVGLHGVILHWNGARWRRMYTGTAENLRAVSGTAHGDVYVSGTNLTQLHFDGTAWSRMTTELEATALSAVPGDLVAVGNIGEVERTRRVVVADEKRCIDPWDDDAKDGTNCDDPDCYMTDHCKGGGACATLSRVTCTTVDLEGSTYTGIARIDDLPCLDISTPGPEASYRFIAESTGPVTVNMTVGSPFEQLALVVMDAPNRACQLDTCRAAPQTSGTQTVTFDAVAGQIYYILVDGPVYRAAPFTLSVGCP